uniref:PDZ domain-containing protein 9 n=1 Tax=Pogona vitticeps TaxID=103695 RepID=A0ABM5FAI0_9SAUR
MSESPRDRNGSVATEEDEERLLGECEDWESDWDSDEGSETDESEHTLATTARTFLQIQEDGLGLIIIQNGPYLQIACLVENGAAARDGKLQSGDVLLKIGHANVLAWTLRELLQLFRNTPIGTIIQIQVYRDFVKLPRRWEAAVNNIPERKGPEIEEVSSCPSEDTWSSSEGSHEDSDIEENGGHAVRFDEDDISPPKWIPEDLHDYDRKMHTLTVGSDIGCDIMIHQDFDTDLPTIGETE